MIRIFKNAGSAAIGFGAGRPDGWRNHDLLQLADRWLERGRSRRALAALDDRQLRDVGLTRADMRLESEKPFWRP